MKSAQFCLLVCLIFAAFVHAQEEPLRRKK